MASFVEDAILRVVDKSTKPVRKINREITKLFRTARKGKNIPIKFSGLGAVRRDVDALARSLRSLPRTKTIGVKLSGAAGARNELRQNLGATRVNLPFKFSGLAAARRDLNARMAKFAATVPVKLRNTTSAASLTASLAKTTVGVAFRFTNVAAAKAKLTAQLGMVNVPMRATGGGGTGGLGPRRTGGGAPEGFWANLRREFSGQRAGRSAGRATVFDLQGEAYIAVRSLIINAGQATIEAQAVTTQQQLTLAQNDIPLVNDIARTLVQTVEGLSFSGARELVSDLAKSIDPSSDSFVPIAKSLFAGIERSRLVDPAKADINELNLVKLLELAQISENPERAGDLVDAFVKGQAAAGKTFNSTSALKALRISGLANTISGDGLFRFLLAFDEQARSLGSGLGRLTKVLNSENGVSDEQRGKLIKSGLVDKNTGRAVNDRLLLENPGAWVEAYLVPALEKMGVDTSDPVAVQRAIEKLGFVTQEFRTVASEIAARGERAQAAKSQADAGLTSAQDASRVDLAASTANLAASFDTLSGEILTPLFETLAPSVDNLANFIEHLALAEGPLANFERAGVAAGVLATTFASFKIGGALLGKLNPLTLTATALNGSAGLLDGAAAALMRAAGVRGAAGGIGGIGGTGPRARQKSGIGAGSKAGLLLGPLGLLMTVDPDSSRAAWTAAGDALVGVVDENLPKAIADIVNVGARKKDERDTMIADAIARGATVTETLPTSFEHWREALGGARAQTTITIEEPKLNLPFTSNDPAKLDRILALMSRNQDKIEEPDRSPASAASLMMQQAMAAQSLVKTGLDQQQADMILQAFNNGADTGREALEMAFGTGTNTMDETFNNASTGMAAVGTDINDAAMAFGPLVGEGLLPLAEQFGMKVGQSAALAFGNVAVTTERRDPPRLANTGTQTPF